MRPAPAIDRTIYTGWNGLYISAFLEAARVLNRADCREFALKTLDRILAEAWNEDEGAFHRVGAPRLDGVLEDQVFLAAALLDAWEDTLEARYFRAAECTMDIVLRKFADAGGGFLDRASDAAPLGGLDFRHKPAQDSSIPSANFWAAIVLFRLQDWTGDARYGDAGRRTLQAFGGISPQYGLFAASLGLAVILERRRPSHVVIIGPSGDAGARMLECAANSVYRFGKAVIHVTQEVAGSTKLPAVLRETLDGLSQEASRSGKAQAIVCADSACYPPVEDAEAMIALLQKNSPADSI